MSLENQVTRVSQGAKDTLKALINMMGGNITDELIDQYPAIASQLLPPTGITGNTVTVTAKEQLDAGNMIIILQNGDGYDAYKATTKDVATSNFWLGIAKDTVLADATADVISIAYMETSSNFVVEQNKGSKQKFWVGTEAEYKAIETKDQNTLYILTDEEGSAPSYVTQEEFTTLSQAVDNKADAPFKPAGKYYLTFSSPNSFTLAVGDATKHWDGTLEYFTSDKAWTTWDGTATLSSVDNDGEYVLYLRGTGNTKIGYYDENVDDYIPWVINGTDVRCDGNIETLLDYASAGAGQPPTMAEDCFGGLFMGCTVLTRAPALPATTLELNCYNSMFCGCTSLTQVPVLPATTLVPYCYQYMFCGCTSLTQVPVLPATTLVPYCYQYMFCDCTSLTQAPALPATTLATYCYASMFSGCTSLTQAPALPATTLAEHCYRNMFRDCTGLTQVPALPATTLELNCYNSMFHGCTGLKLSSIQTGEYTREYRIPITGTGTTASSAFISMFASTGGTFTEAPEINTTYYLSTDNMVVRETEIATLNGYVGSMIDDVAQTLQNKADLDESGKVPSDQLPEMNYAPASHAAQHASGGTDPITPASIGAAASNHTHTPASIGAAQTVTLTCTVPVSWTASGSYYYQQVSVSGMLASDNPVADILPGSDNDANKLYAEAWGKVQSIDTLAGAVGIWCTEAPTVAFPVQFKVVR